MTVTEKPVTDQEWDADVYRRLAELPEGTYTYPKSWPRQLLDDLGYVKADMTPVFSALKRLERSQRIERVITERRSREHFGGVVYSASRIVTITIR